MYTGRPGTGKTASLVNDVWKALNEGEIIYSNFWIAWDGYEEKRTWVKKILMRMGLKKEWKSYPASNLRSWETLRDIISTISMAPQKINIIFGSNNNSVLH